MTDDLDWFFYPETKRERPNAPVSAASSELRHPGYPRTIDYSDNDGSVKRTAFYAPPLDVSEVCPF